MALLTDGRRFMVDRELGLAVFARHLALLQEGRVEAAEVPVGDPAHTVLHLTLGVQPIALLDPEAFAREDGVRSDHTEPLSITDLFPDFDLFQSDGSVPRNGSG